MPPGQGYFGPFGPQPVMFETNSFDLNQAVINQMLGKQQMLRDAITGTSGSNIVRKDMAGNVIGPFDRVPTGLDNNRELNPGAFDAQGNYLGYGGNGGVANPTVLNGNATVQAQQAQQQRQFEADLLDKVRRGVEAMLQGQGEAAAPTAAEVPVAAVPSPAPVPAPVPSQAPLSDEAIYHQLLNDANPNDPLPPQNQGGDVFANAGPFGSDVFQQGGGTQVNNAAAQPPREVSIRLPATPTTSVPVPIPPAGQVPIPFAPNTGGVPQVPIPQFSGLFDTGNDFTLGQVQDPMRTQGVPEHLGKQGFAQGVDIGHVISNWLFGSDPQKLQQQQQQRQQAQDAAKRQQPLPLFP